MGSMGGGGWWLVPGRKVCVGELGDEGFWGVDMELGWEVCPLDGPMKRHGRMIFELDRGKGAL